mgnify:CR=1 FL=1
MRRRHVLFVICLFTFGCAVSEELLPLDKSHPASPSATSAPPHQLNDTLSPPREANDGIRRRAGHSEHNPYDATARSYVCPMHSDVVSDRPGRCPKCGMKLVPNTQGDNDGH